MARENLLSISWLHSRGLILCYMRLVLTSLTIPPKVAEFTVTSAVDAFQQLLDGIFLASVFEIDRRCFPIEHRPSYNRILPVDLCVLEDKDVPGWPVKFVLPIRCTQVFAQGLTIGFTSRHNKDNRAGVGLTVAVDLSERLNN